MRQSSIHPGFPHNAPVKTRAHRAGIPGHKAAAIFRQAIPRDRKVKWIIQTVRASFHKVTPTRHKAERIRRKVSAMDHKVVAIFDHALRIFHKVWTI